MAEIPPLEKIYESVLERLPPALPEFKAQVEERALQKALSIHNYLQDRADRTEQDCILCEKKKARRSQTRGVYETPWDEEETEKPFCSEECADIYLYEEPWAYFTCGACERTISEQNRRNGWHVQYRDYDGLMVCLKCYEGLVLENGSERDKLEKGQIPGMFFSYGNSEPLEAGYREVEGFTNFFVRSSESVDTFRKKALELMDQGKRVVIGYERMAIGGLEGYVTLMAREPPMAGRRPLTPSVKGSKRRRRAA